MTREEFGVGDTKIIVPSLKTTGDVFKHHF
jgi:hypothetical protein